MEFLEFSTKHDYFWFENMFFLQERGVAMGAKFAPSLANLCLAKQEEDVLYAQDRPELVLWARYLDDILLLWNGDDDSLCDFMALLNTNDRGISLSYETIHVKSNMLEGPYVHFPLELMSIQRKIRVTNHSVPKHYLQYHNKDPKGAQFLIINKYISPWRGGPSIRGVSQLETFLDIQT